MYVYIYMYVCIYMYMYRYMYMYMYMCIYYIHINIWSILTLLYLNLITGEKLDLFHFILSSVICVSLFLKPYLHIRFMLIKIIFTGTNMANT